MADPKNRLFRVGDWNLDMPVPNPGLQEWLNSPAAKAAVEKVTREVYVAYVNSLPEITGTLKAGASPGVGRRKYPGQSERYYGWVINKAVSYNEKKGEPYPRFIEYGKKNVNGGRTKAGHHLLRAAYEVARKRGVAAAELAGITSQLDANPAHHQARPATPKRRKSKNYLNKEERKKGYREEDAYTGGQNLNVQQRRAQAIRAEQERIAAARRAAMQKRINDARKNK